MTELPEPAAGRVVIEERMHPLSPLVSVWVGVVAIAWFAFNEFLQGSKIFSDLSRFGENVPWYLWIVLGGVLVFLVFSYWSWWTTKFVIDDTELRIENTGAFQESKRIAFSRIQSVDISQPFAARLLGLAELRIDVGADAGTKLSYLSRSRAGEIRDYLMKRAHGRSATTSEPSAAASVWNDLSTDDQVLIRLTPGELAAATVLSVEFLMTLLVLSVPLVIAYGFGLPDLLVGTGFIPILLALSGIVSTRLIGQFNYTLARTDAGLRITRGLFTLKSQTVPAHRVQAIRISQPLPWRWLNRARLDVTVLGLGGGEGEEMTTTILLPTGNPRQVQVALAAVWPGLRLEELTFQGPPRQARWLSPLQFRWMGYALNDQVVVSRGGWIIRAQHIVPHARLQSAALHQGPLQRRLGLATIKLHTTNLLGTEAIAHMAQDAARWLVYTEMDRARAARTGELIDPPGLRAPVELVADATPPDTLWTPPTSVAAAAVDGGRITGEGTASDLPR